MDQGVWTFHGTPPGTPEAETNRIAQEAYDKYYRWGWNQENKPGNIEPVTPTLPTTPDGWQAPEGYADTWQDAMRGGWKPEAGHGGDPDLVQRQYEEWATSHSEFGSQRSQLDEIRQASQGQLDWNRQARDQTAAWEAGRARDQANYDRMPEVRIPEWDTWDLQRSQYGQYNQSPSPTSIWDTRQENLYDLRGQQQQRLWQAQQTQRESQWQRQFDTERSQQQSAWDTQMSQAQNTWEDQMSQAQNTWNTQYDLQQGHISNLTGQIGGLETTLAEQNAANRAWREGANRERELLIKDAERARTAAAYGSQGSQLNPKVRGVRTNIRPRSARPWIGRGTTGAFNRGGMRINSLNI